MGLKYLIDTNIFIRHIVGETEYSHLFKEDFMNENVILTSQIVKIELLSYSGLTDITEQVLKNMLNQFNIIGITGEIEYETIQLRKDSKIKLPDAIIAATAIVEDATLVTYDKKDFQKVKELKIY